MACNTSTALTQTPAQSGQGLMTFFVPSSVYLVAADTPTGIVNQSVLFHEGLHGYTGHSDGDFLSDFGYNAFNDPPCKITDYLELKIWGGTIENVPIKKFSLLLPALQVPLAITLWELGRYAQVPRRLDTLSSPTSTLVSYGINAPAVFFRALVFPLTRGNPLRRPPDVFGFDLEQLAFFVGVGVLWYLAGRALDRQISYKLLSPARITIGELVLDLCLMLLGLAILLEGIQGFRDPWRWNNRFGNYIESTLFVAWSLVLTGIPMLRLVKRKHAQRARFV